MPDEGRNHFRQWSSPDTVASPGEQIRAGDCKGIDRSVRQAGIDCTPACAIVGGKKDAAAVSPGKEIRARDHKSIDISVGQAATDRRPVYAVVEGKKNATTAGAGKEIRAVNGEGCKNAAVRSISLSPLRIRWIRTGEQAC